MRPPGSSAGSVGGPREGGQDARSVRISGHRGRWGLQVPAGIASAADARGGAAR